jgi:hypothetical protein
MRRLVLAAATAAAIATAVVGGTAQPARADGGAVVASASGGGNIDLFGTIRVFSFDAEEHADGSVTGEFEIRYRPFGAVIHGVTTCLRVVGNEAVMTGVVTFSTFAPVQPGFMGTTTVVDNGEGAGAAPDLISWPTTPAATPSDCEFVTPVADQPVEFGNVQVSG